jgi:asparagine synthase (glutamine-hydrolyzing)
MCGVACLLGSTDTSFIERARQQLKHRGPDSNGMYSDGAIQMLHTRLSILDLTPSGHQPMVSHTGRYVISFNGEIYNHQALRDKYLSGFNFCGHSDTETILELFALKGERMLEEMVGMWAILIWDTETKRLFVSRDRFGQKPMYYIQHNGALAIASEIKPLLPLLPGTTPDYTMVTEYVAMGNYGHLGTRTFFKEVTQVPTSAYAWISTPDETIKWQYYWRIPKLPTKGGRKADAAFLKELKGAIEEAVFSQTLSDIPIGITLSGGIDSSIIAGILLRHYPEKLHVFTSQTPGSKYDETKYVDAVLRGFEDKYVLHKTNLNQLFTPGDVGRSISIQEEPFGDPSIIAQHQLMKLADEHNIRVILGGQGADEIFWGYDNLLSAVLGKAILKGRTDLVKYWMDTTRMSRGTQMRSAMIGLLPSIERKMRQRSRNKRKEFLPEAWKLAADKTEVANYSDLDAVWEDSLRGVHIPHLLHYDDRNGMSVSVEGRMPFMDHRILELVAQLDPLEHIRDGVRKSILRKACDEYLPMEVKQRRDKVGFFTPLHSYIWDNIELFRKPVEDIGTKQILGDFELCKNRSMSPEATRRLWRVYSFDLFMREFNG